MRNAEAARATTGNSAAWAHFEKRPETARRVSEPRGYASCDERHAEVTNSASCRGGAVCLPDAIIPKSCPAIGVDPRPGRPFVLKSCCRCRRLAPKGAGCCAVRRLAEQVLRVALHQVCCIYCGPSRAASESTETERGLAPSESRVNPGVRRVRAAYFISTTLPSVNKARLKIQSETKPVQRSFG